MPRTPHAIVKRRMHIAATSAFTAAVTENVQSTDPSLANIEVEEIEVQEVPAPHFKF